MRSLDIESAPIDIYSLRGRNLDIYRMRDEIFRAIKPGEYGMIVIDSYYRTFPAGTNENDNGQMMLLGNIVDAAATKTDAAIVLTLHTPKGNTSARAAIDLASGAGSFGRQCDFMLALRQHAEPGCAVVESILRTLPSPDMYGIRFEYPLWRRDDSIDVTQLRAENRGPGRPAKNNRDAPLIIPPEPAWDPDRFCTEIIDETPIILDAVVSRAKRAKISRETAKGLLAECVAAGSVLRSGSPRTGYSFQKSPKTLF
jgi:hypothetical protein